MSAYLESQYSCFAMQNFVFNIEKKFKYSLLIFLTTYIHNYVGVSLVDIHEGKLHHTV